MRDPTEVAAKAKSVSSRIKDVARKGGLDTMALLKRYALERFLARLSAGPHGKSFTLKGGLVMPLVTGNMARPTDDIDGSFEHEMTPDEVRAFIAEISATDPPDEDGMVYGTGKVDVLPIREGLLPGARVTFDAELATEPRPNMLRIKVDLCYGDHILPDPVWRTLPVSLPGTVPTDMLCYHWASVFSEKLHAIYRHGDTNTRMKDYNDLLALSRNLDLDGPDLVQALEGTFRMWGGTLTADAVGLTDRFAASKAQAWRQFRKTPAGRTADTDDFQVVVREVRAFAMPVVEACLSGERPNDDWVAGKGWVTRAVAPTP